MKKLSSVDSDRYVKRSILKTDGDSHADKSKTARLFLMSEEYLHSTSLKI